jgi:UDP-N-acetylmuramate dehydrogenase
MDELLNKFEHIRADYNLADLTSFKIGGNAKYFLETKDINELKEVLFFCQENNIDFKVIGGGSNLLVNDTGFNGLIIKYINREMSLENDIFKVGAGVVLLNFVNYVSQKKYTGQEALAGIPGTIGGAIYGNAGAYGQDIGNIIKLVKVLDEKGEIKILSPVECQFEYRHSVFSSNNYIILEAEIKLEKGTCDSDCQKTIKERIMMRVQKHPLNFPNSGSWFKNIFLTDEVKEKLKEFDLSKFEKYQKIPAAFLIEQAGCKGHQIGGAQMSEKHANFLINKEDAKAQDVIDLSDYIKKVVKEKYDIELEEEVQYVGF